MGKEGNKFSNGLTLVHTFEDVIAFDETLMQSLSISDNPNLTKDLKEPIKMSLHTTTDGSIRLTYDDLLDGKGVESADTDCVPSKTTYEIDLFCYACNHFYRSLISLNRHFRTKKHSDQVTKLSEMREVRRAKKRHVQRNWSNYESYLSKNGLLAREVYDSIVHQLLEDSDNKKTVTKYRPANYHQDQANELNRSHNWKQQNDSPQLPHQRFKIRPCTNYKEMYETDSNGFDTNTSECFVCFEQFPSPDVLQMHIQNMTNHCSNVIDSMDSDSDILDSFIVSH